MKLVHHVSRVNPKVGSRPEPGTVGVHVITGPPRNCLSLSIYLGGRVGRCPGTGDGDGGCLKQCLGYSVQVVSQAVHGQTAKTPRGRSRFQVQVSVRPFC